MPNDTTVPASNPFQALPFPSPGDRIKAEDFRALSQSLQILYDIHVLSSSLLGQTLAEAKTALAAQRYEVLKVMTVLGNELSNPGDSSMDQHKVIQILPAALGDKRVLIVLAEAVDTRKFTPNLAGLTYREASERLRAFVGDLPSSGGPMLAPQWVGHSLAEAQTIR